MQMPAARRQKAPMSPWWVLDNRHAKKAKTNAKRYNTTRALRCWRLFGDWLLAIGNWRGRFFGDGLLEGVGCNV